MVLHLAVPAEQQSLHWLSAQVSADPATLMTALRLAAGAPAAALEFLSSEQQTRRMQFCQTLSGAIPDDSLSLLPLLTQDDVALRIHWLMSLLLDCVKYHQNSLQWMTNTDQQALIARLATVISLPALHQSLTLWKQCRHRILETPAVNHELLVTEALLDWEQLFLPAV
ncbi:DNA polymerase III subunit delta' [Tatumella ptyseos]|nr:DNA polymerase III subunit delta' [Tatumella ptyseos]